eukprot:TRINITY_DN3736_c0_g1_i2.p1 TRINITY_DN3736_c0_g1~~TRINITY_DN3736_c0_g1_i2.p1  ORF type:complete len:209 (+),score=59.15 TRINITY_DN3736_c0_g1_i2:579-1205(+)
MKERDPVPLSIHHMPICVTFGLFEVDNQTIFLVDPQWKEEQVMKGKLTMILNIHRELCGVHKAGGLSLDSSQLIKAAQIATVKVKEITLAIKDALKKDSLVRGKSVDFPSVDLMTFGIGTKQEEGGSLAFCDGPKSIPISDPSQFQNQSTPPVFSKEEERKELEQFISTKFAATVLTQDEVSKDDMVTNNDDEDYDEEEEGETLINTL